MPNLSKVIVLTVVAAAMASSSAEAQWVGPRGPFDHCSTPQPVAAPMRSAGLNPACLPAHCTCAETAMVPRQQVTYRNVSETRYRPETVTRMVPVTVYKQEQQTRMVPYTVTRRVPQVRTVYQPQTTLRTYPAYGYTAPQTAVAPISSQPAVPQTASKLPPHPDALSLKELDTPKATYDDTPVSSSTRAASRRHIGRSAASVFRKFQ
ncbi:MAG: hypothetical protein HUJ26_24375 [Planctomycetaceae bacterium]|nr:hypothetical protein [Planctomycetaceae bacterium]